MEDHEPIGSLVPFAVTTTPTGPLGNSMNTLLPFIQRYMGGRVAVGSYGPKSRRVVTPRLRSLSDHFGRRPLSHLTRGAIERWLGDLSHLSTNSRASYLASVRQFTAWMLERGHVDKDPCALIPRARRAKPVPRALTQHDVATILAATRTERDEAIVWLMVGIGLRRMEVANLRWEDYAERDGTILVRGKGDKERLLPVPSVVAAALRRVRDATSGPIVRCHRSGRGLTPESVGAVMTRLMWEAGVKNAPYDGRSGHALRHTAASDVLDECGDLRVVQELLGHEHLSTTSIYLRRVSAAQMRAAVEGRDYRAA